MAFRSFKQWFPNGSNQSQRSRDRFELLLPVSVDLIGIREEEMVRSRVGRI